MKMTRKFLFLGAVAAGALVCSATGAGVFGAASADSTLQASLDDLDLRMADSVARWQPASGYVPVDYPTDGSWERMAAAAGR